MNLLFFHVTIIQTPKTTKGRGRRGNHWFPYKGRERPREP